MDDAEELPRDKDGRTLGLSVHGDTAISFEYSENYCVCFVDIVDSTRLALGIRQSNRVREFYSTYFNTLSAVVKSFNSIIVKNSGDCLIYYFPATSDSTDVNVFRQVLDCAFAVLSGAHCARAAS